MLRIRIYSDSLLLAFKDPDELKLKILGLTYVYFFPLVTSGIYLPFWELFISDVMLWKIVFVNNRSETGRIQTRIRKVRIRIQISKKTLRIRNTAKYQLIFKPGFNFEYRYLLNWLWVKRLIYCNLHSNPVLLSVSFMPVFVFHEKNVHILDTIFPNTVFSYSKNLYTKKILSCYISLFKSSAAINLLQGLRW